MAALVRCMLAVEVACQGTRRGGSLRFGFSGPCMIDKVTAREPLVLDLCSKCACLLHVLRSYAGEGRRQAVQDCQGRAREETQGGCRQGALKSASMGRKGVRANAAACFAVGMGMMREKACACSASRQKQSSAHALQRLPCCKTMLGRFSFGAGA